MGSILSVLVLAVGLYYTNQANRAQQEANRRQLEVAVQDQVTDRFSKTVEQLGSDSVDVRLGAIYALERLMRDSADDQAAVVDILAAYVRTHAPRDATGRPESAVVTDRPRLPTVDVQTALSVLGRRNSDKDRPHSRLDLRRTDLTGVDLEGAELRTSDLSDAILEGANLSGAKLDRVNFSQATLNRANLSRASLNEADLPDAVLRGANLHDVVLEHANLRRADFSDANLDSASLRAADVVGAQFASAKNLERHQVACTVGDETTSVPDGMVVPSKEAPASQEDCDARSPGVGLSTGSTRLSLSKPSGPSGVQVEVIGDFFEPNTSVEIMFHTTLIKQVTTDNTGSFRTVVTIPDEYSVFAPARFDISAVSHRPLKFSRVSFQLDS